MEKKILKYASTIGQILKERGQTIATAESCTSGLLSHKLTGVSGSSAYFMGGVVAYDNRIKEDILGVQRQTLLAYGAVSQQTAAEMAAGICKLFKVDYGLSTTGIAGPTGATPQKPVGLVFLGISTPQGETKTFECRFDGNRLENKMHSVLTILKHLSEMLNQSN